MNAIRAAQVWRDQFRAPAAAFLFADCTLPYLLRIVRGAKFSFENLWREMFTRDLFQRGPRLDVPVYLLEGRRTASSLAAAR
ncbi:MAG: hypothetical protein H0T11_07515 [Chthoniobacterales bacterium]|nr:hypothetical protein [Chthoniobacterales bacterium]